MAVMLFIGCLSLAGGLALAVAVLVGKRTAEPVQIRVSAPHRRAAVEAAPSPSLVSTLAQRSAGLAGRMTRDGYAARLQGKLDVAGNPVAWPVARIMALKGIGMLIGLAFGGLYGFKLGGLALVLPLVGAAVGFLVPDIWIRNLGERRQVELRNGLPDVIDMMTVCVEAGLGFDGALSRVALHLDNPAAAEFARVLQEMQLGKSRVESLRDAATRVDVSEFRAFVSSMVQASELGISIGDVLRAQAGQMRIKRRQRAEEAAQKLPVKILFPLMFCILPALFVVVLGPAVMSVVGVFSHS